MDAILSYRPFSKVTDNIYIGNIAVAQDLAQLKRYGITHVVAAAANAKCYHPDHFTYLQFDVEDTCSQDIKKHLTEAVQFIDQAVENGGKVYIHCFAGISRSSSTTIAYFMYKQRMTFKDAWRFVKDQHPPAFPNVGFQQQLQLYEQELGIE